MKINELNTQLNGLCKNVKKLLTITGMNSYGNLAYVEFDRNSSNDNLLHDEFYDIMQKLDNICFTVKYLNAKVMGEYILYKNANGRYECSEYTYTSGSPIEFLYYDEFEKTYKWAISRVEHNGKDYYIVNYSRLSLDGLQVRIKE